jgi:hypothetical protein
MAVLLDDNSSLALHQASDNQISSTAAGHHDIKSSSSHFFVDRTYLTDLTVAQ